MRNKDKWIHWNCWVACFDILGFKDMVSFDDNGSIKALYVMDDYEETLKHLKKVCDVYEEGDISYCWLSDTFIMFTPDDSARAYSVIEGTAKYFMDKCLYTCVPLRGAISVGTFTRSIDNRAFLGKAFIDAFNYANDQDWIGLILTPMAIKKIETYNLDLIYDFVADGSIPMRNYNPKEVRAYRFQNGAMNMPSRFLSELKDMKAQSGKKHKAKYERTEAFIQRHYQFIK